MEPTPFSLGAFSGFLLGYLFGHRDLRFEKFLEPIRKLPGSLHSLFKKDKVHITSAPDVVLPELKEDPTDA